MLRYVADVLEEHEDYPEREFWTHAREAVLGYQAKFPELEERFKLFDLLQSEFTKCSLNRNRLFDNGYDDAPRRPYASEYGMVPNPLHEVIDGGDERERPSAGDN